MQSFEFTSIRIQEDVMKSSAQHDVHIEKTCSRGTCYHRIAHKKRIPFDHFSVVITINKHNNLHNKDDKQS